MKSSNRLLRRITDTAVACKILLRAEWAAMRRRRPRMLLPDRSVLLLAQWLPPDRVMGGSYRPTSFLQYAGENGWRAAAITRELDEPPDRAALELASRIPEDVPIIRVPPPAFQASRRVIPKLDGTMEMALQVFDVGRRRFSSSPPSVIVASGPPFHNFLAAFYLSRQLGCRFALDYRDEWTECPFPFVSSGPSDRAMETRILRHADGVLFTTRSQLEHAVRTFRTLDRERCHLLANGWEPSSGVSSDGRLTRARSRKVISFVGNLAPHTHPGPFLDMLEELVKQRPRVADQVRLRLVGPIHEHVRKRLDRFAHPTMIERVGMLPLPQAQCEMAVADALILFAGPDLSRYLPGKLFEYLAAKRPIIVYGEPGEAADLVSSLSAGRRVRGPQDFLNFLDDLDELEGALGNAKLESWLAEHRRESLAGRFYGILDRVVGNVKGSGGADAGPTET